MGYVISVELMVLVGMWMREMARVLDSASSWFGNCNVEIVLLFFICMRAIDLNKKMILVAWHLPRFIVIKTMFILRSSGE